MQPDPTLEPKEAAAVIEPATPAPRSSEAKRPSGILSFCETFKFGLLYGSSLAHVCLICTLEQSGTCLSSIFDLTIKVKVLVVCLMICCRLL